MKMHNPPHPGEILKTLCLEPLNLTVTEAARSLGISRKTLSGILNARAGISPEMAVRLSMAFNTSAESWLARAERSSGVIVSRLRLPPSAPYFLPMILRYSSTSGGIPLGIRSSYT